MVKPAMTLLDKMERQRKERAEGERVSVRNQLRSSIRELLPKQRVIVFGSLTQPGRFTQASDVDLALFQEPQSISIFGLTAELEERLRRPVDVVLLDECRFRDKILREGEVWTSSD